MVEDVIDCGMEGTIDCGMEGIGMAAIRRDVGGGTGPRLAERRAIPPTMPELPLPLLLIPLPLLLIPLALEPLTPLPVLKPMPAPTLPPLPRPRPREDGPFDGLNGAVNCA